MSYKKNSANIWYSQNKIINKKLLRRLVDQSSVSEGDLVYDIGAGSGAISEALLNKGARVIAFETDGRLYQKCRQQFAIHDKYEIHNMDFLDWKFPQGQRFKVFSNIPFIQTADIVNKIVFNKDPPEDGYLIIQKEAAEKYAGNLRETLVSLLIKPIFWVDIIYYFERNDFFPVPLVDIVLLQIEKRRCQLIPEQHYGLYKDFVIYCREGSNRTIKKSLKHLVTYSQLKQLSRLMNIDYQSTPSELNFMQYLSIFQFYLGNNPRNTALIRGTEQRLHEQQANRVKKHRTTSKARQYRHDDL